MSADPNVKSIVLVDLDAPENRPLSRFGSIFSTRDGIFSPLARLRLQYPSARIFLEHPDQKYASLIAEVEGLSANTGDHRAPGPDALRFDSGDLKPWTMLARIGERIESDLKTINADQALAATFAPPTDRALSIMSDKHPVLAHQSARIAPGCVFNPEDGPIILDADVRVSPFSYIEGPCYVGPHARVDDARLTGGVILGRHARVGGEIENSILGDFTNKHHEGFVGHSVIGRWVNLGALTTTSDLKNNYGEVRLELPVDFIPTPPDRPETRVLSTGEIKFGSIIGDCVKTAIGTMLNTGTVLDAGSNIFGARPPKYMPFLSWGSDGDRYDPERFLNDCAVIFKRRGESPHPRLADLVLHFLSPII